MMSNSEALYPRRVKVSFRIRVSVVATMMSNPPQRSSLRGARTEPGTNELGHSSSFECVVTELAVVEAADSYATRQVHKYRNYEGKPAEPYGEHKETAKMNGDVGDREFEETRHRESAVIH
jgi:hypothetical protein